MSFRIPLGLLLAATLAGCADPPGLSKPKPFDLNEENRSTAAYNKYKNVIQATDGVLTTYLTQNNNPRRLMVVVKDQKTADKVWNDYNRVVLVDGLQMKVEVVHRADDGDDPIEAVPTESVPDTWWGKIVQFLQSIRAPWQPAK